MFVQVDMPFFWIILLSLIVILIFFFNNVFVQEIIEEGESSRAKEVLNDERYKSFKVNLLKFIAVV